jgi:hypothetical protein
MNVVVWIVVGIIGSVGFVLAEIGAYRLGVRHGRELAEVDLKGAKMEAKAWKQIACATRMPLRKEAKR